MKLMPRATQELKDAGIDLVVRRTNKGVCLHDPKLITQTSIVRKKSKECVKAALEGERPVAAKSPFTDKIAALSVAELAYIAGFFDGEGSVTIHENGKPSPRGISPNHTVQVSIGNTNPTVLEWISSVFGGAVYRRESKIVNHRAMSQWTIKAVRTLPFLEAIRPYVRMKGKQIDIAISFQKTKSMRGKEQVPLGVVVRREQQRREIRKLNGRNCNAETELR